MNEETSAPRETKTLTFEWPAIKMTVEVDTGEKQEKSGRRFVDPELGDEARRHMQAAMTEVIKGVRAGLDSVFSALEKDVGAAPKKDRVEKVDLS